MKKLFTLLLFVASTTCFAQIPELMRGNWKINVRRDINNYAMYREEGVNAPARITNIEYTPSYVVINEIENRSSKEMWTAEKKQTALDYLNEKGIGGRITIFVTRTDISDANANGFTMIIQDSVKNEVFRQEFDHKTPEAKYGNEWYNIFYGYIPLMPSQPFYVYIIDTKRSERHTFRLSKL